MAKMKVVKDYKKLDKQIIEKIKELYPLGFSDKLISFKNGKGETVRALPFSTDEIDYLVKIPLKQPVSEDDEDASEDDEFFALQKKSGKIDDKVKVDIEDDFGNRDDEDDDPYGKDKYSEDDEDDEDEDDEGGTGSSRTRGSRNRRNDDDDDY